MDFDIFSKKMKMTKSDQNLDFFSNLTEVLLAADPNSKQILEVGIEIEIAVIGHSISQQLFATGKQKRHQRHTKC